MKVLLLNIIILEQRIESTVLSINIRDNFNFVKKVIIYIPDFLNQVNM